MIIVITPHKYTGTESVIRGGDGKQKHHVEGMKPWYHPLRLEKTINKNPTNKNMLVPINPNFCPKLIFIHLTLYNFQLINY